MKYLTTIRKAQNKLASHHYQVENMLEHIKDFGDDNDAEAAELAMYCQLLALVTWDEYLQACAEQSMSAYTEFLYLRQHTAINKP